MYPVRLKEEDMISLTRENGESVFECKEKYLGIMAKPSKGG